MLGPEGGWTEAEREQAFSAGWTGRLLGPQILPCGNRGDCGHCGDQCVGIDLPMRVLSIRSPSQRKTRTEISLFFGLIEIGSNVSVAGIEGRLQPIDSCLQLLVQVVQLLLSRGCIFLNQVHVLRLLVGSRHRSRRGGGAVDRSLAEGFPAKQKSERRCPDSDGRLHRLRL